MAFLSIDFSSWATLLTRSAHGLVRRISGERGAHFCVQMTHSLPSSSVSGRGLEPRRWRTRQNTLLSTTPNGIDSIDQIAQAAHEAPAATTADSEWTTVSVKKQKKKRAAESSLRDQLAQLDHSGRLEYLLAFEIPADSETIM